MYEKCGISSSSECGGDLAAEFAVIVFMCVCGRVRVHHPFMYVCIYSYEYVIFFFICCMYLYIVDMIFRINPLSLLILYDEHD